MKIFYYFPFHFVKKKKAKWTHWFPFLLMPTGLRDVPEIAEPQNFLGVHFVSFEDPYKQGIFVKINI